jgi:hypothetical protein
MNNLREFHDVVVEEVFGLISREGEGGVKQHDTGKNRVIGFMNCIHCQISGDLTEMDEMGSGIQHV